MKQLLLTTITLFLFLGFNQESLASNSLLDLRAVGLSTTATYDGCKDKNQQNYNYRTILPLFEKGYYYIVECGGVGNHRYMWDVKSVKKSRYTDKIYTDGLGCRDSDGRIYDTGSVINEYISYNSYGHSYEYTCVLKNEKHF